MATNGNNTGNIDFGKNDSYINDSGVSSALQNRAAKQMFQNDFYKKGSGYLDNNTRSLEEMNKLFNDLTKSITSLDKQTQKQIQKQKDALQQWLNKSKEIQENQNISSKEAMKYVEKTNETRLKASLEYQKIVENIVKNSKDLAENEQDYAEILKSELEGLAEGTKQINNEIAEQNNQIERTKQILDKTQGSFAKGLSQTLDSASKSIQGIVNMFNINSLANSGINKFFSEKLDMQNKIMQYYTMESKAQYTDFKRSLNNTIKSMGDLYNSDDLNNFMANISTLGIANQGMAQQLMKSSIQATKYLGMSDETQTAMFKYMKLTNNNEALSKYNEKVVGLLESDLNVSKEQLDMITQMALANVDNLAASGISDEALEEFTNQYEAVGAAFESMGLGDDYTKSLMNAIDEFANVNYLNMAEFEQKYGAGASGLAVNMQNTGNVKDVARYLVNNYGDYLKMSDNVTANSTLQEMLGANKNAIAASKIAKNKGGFEEALAEALSAGPGNVNKYIEDTNETTTTDKIYNKLTMWFDGINWHNLTGLATAAFALQTGSNVINAFGSLAQIKSLGGFSKLFSSAGGSSKALEALSGKGGLLATGGGLLLGAAAATAIIGAIVEAEDSIRNNKNQIAQEDALAQIKGTSIEGNNAYAGAVGVAQSTRDSGAPGFNQGTSGVSYLFSKLIKSDRRTLNRKLTHWMLNSNVLNSELKAAAWAILMSSVGDLSAFNEGASTNMSVSDLKQLFEQGVLTEDSVNEMAESFIKAGYLPYTDNSGGRLNSFKVDPTLDGYHKSGKSFIPKDGYKAILHKGEMVLNEEDAEVYRRAQEAQEAAKNGFGIGGYESVPWEITSRYKTSSKIRSGYHTGTDFGIPEGTAVGAANGGTVYGTNVWGGAWGNDVVVKGNNGVYYLYAHFMKPAIVKSGDTVTTGQVLGYSGSTGNSTGPHLHFEIQRSSSWARGNELDPEPYATAGLVGDGSAISPEGIVGSSGSSSSDTKDSSGKPSILGSANKSIISNADGTSSSTGKSKGTLIRTGSFIPSNMRGIGGEGLKVGGAEQVTNSIDNNFNKLINYLNDIRNEQNEQREMLNAFSQLNSGGTL